MSGSSKNKGSGSNPMDFSSIESLLDDIEAEEKQLSERFPSTAAESLDDLDDLEDIEDIDDLDDFDDLEDIEDPDSLEDSFDNFSAAEDRNSDSGQQRSQSVDETPAQTDGSYWDEPGQQAAKPAGLLDSVRNMLNGKDGRNNALPLIIIALLAIIILILLLQNCQCGSTKQQDDWFDTSAIEGTLPGKTPEEIQAMLNQIVEEGMFNISIAPEIVFENARAKGQARIENVPANHYHMSVKITLDDTQETIYQSKGIRPGEYIEYITLEKDLQPGGYDATALFSAHDADNHSEQGRVAVKIKIIVG